MNVILCYVYKRKKNVITNAAAGNQTKATCMPGQHVLYHIAIKNILYRKAIQV